jgi:hypothetical protein
MNILASWAVGKAALAPGLAFGLPAAIRADELDGFAIGALLSGACFLMAASPRLTWRALFGWPARLTRRARLARRALFTGRARVAAATGAHRSPPRWARTGTPRAEVRRVIPRHAAPQARLASRMTGLLPSRGHASSVT